MGRKTSRPFRTPNASVLSEDISIGSIYNIPENASNILKLMEASVCMDADKRKLLYWYGQKGIDIKDIAIILNMKTKDLQNIMDKGENDLQSSDINTRNSVEAQCYRAYYMGVKELEASLVDRAKVRDAMKLLEHINPEKYGKDVSDRYELASLNITFSDGVKKVIDEERDEEEDD